MEPGLPTRPINRGSLNNSASGAWKSSSVVEALRGMSQEIDLFGYDGGGGGGGGGGDGGLVGGGGEVCMGTTFTNVTLPEVARPGRDAS
jgi:hypothetical protein